MWSSVRNGLSKKTTDQSSQVNAAPANVQTISANENSEAEPHRSPQLDQMIREISGDLSDIVKQENASVRSQFASKAREHCMKDISHDLRTPLNAIIGFAQMMENGALGQIENPQYIEYLRHIRESGYELLGQVEDLLNEDVSIASTSPGVAKLFGQTKQLEEAVA